MNDSRFLFVCLSLFVCASVNAGDFADSIETAHGKRAWYAQQAVQAKVKVTFGGTTMIDGTMLFTPSVGRARIDQADGTSIVFDGSRAWVSPASSPLEMARFHVLTWPYFLAAPFKLNDPGTNLEPLGELPLQDTAHGAARLSFDPGTGDAPDDWYILYRDPDNDRLAAMAYIVTYGKPVAQVREEPHAIVYEDFDTIDGVTVSTTWRFYHWSREKGPHGDPIGHVTLENVEFVKPGDQAFAKPEDAREDRLPQTADAPAKAGG